MPAVFGAGIYQINVFANMFLAARLDEEGSVSFLGYSNRLMEFVLGVFVGKGRTPAPIVPDPAPASQAAEPTPSPTPNPRPAEPSRS